MTIIIRCNCEQIHLPEDGLKHLMVSKTNDQGLTWGWSPASGSRRRSSRRNCAALAFSLELHLALLHLVLLHLVLLLLVHLLVQLHLLAVSGSWVRDTPPPPRCHPTRRPAQRWKQEVKVSHRQRSKHQMRNEGVEIHSQTQMTKTDASTVGEKNQKGGNRQKTAITLVLTKSTTKNLSRFEFSTTDLKSCTWGTIS